MENNSRLPKVIFIGISNIVSSFLKPLNHLLHTQILSIQCIGLREDLPLSNNIATIKYSGEMNGIEFDYQE